MKSTATTLAATDTITRASAADYLELTKPRISVLELVAVVAAMHLALASTGGAWQTWPTLAMLVGTALLAASANALNQYLERFADEKMVRTRNRPLPSGRMRPGEALWFGMVCVAVGLTLIAVGVNPLTAALGFASWFLYVGVYTPMKSRSTFNTTVGAVTGAIPILMGWTAAGGQLDQTALGLFAVLMIWQYPHFMAIAWLCREDYARAAYKMSTTADPTGGWAGAQAVAGALLLLPAALLVAVGLGTGAVAYSIAATLLMVYLLVPAIRFYRDRNDQTARKLMRASLIYLPLWMVAFSVWLP